MYGTLNVLIILQYLDKNNTRNSQQLWPPVYMCMHTHACTHKDMNIGGRLFERRKSVGVEKGKRGSCRVGMITVDSSHVFKLPK